MEDLMKHEFTDSVVMITGAAQGLGRAIAEGFAAAGAKLALIDLNEKKLSETAGSLGGAAYICDITSPEEVAVAAARIEQETGGIDILVNNAGIAGTDSILDLTVEKWRRMIDVNLSGAFYCIQTVARGMIKRGRGGRIINISSLAGRNGGIMTSPSYAASKAGILGLTKAAARQLAPHRITVNAVSPGSLQSEMLNSFGEEKVAALTKSVPLGRLGSFNDVREAVLFLASKEAEFVDGVCIDVNGAQFMAP
jgi:3-oxoacyl-[acyl-carrier protein] reductase